MTDEALADMLATCIKASNEEVDVLIGASECIWLINEVQRARRERREGDHALLDWSRRQVPA